MGPRPETTTRDDGGLDSGERLEVEAFTVPALAARYGVPDLVRIDVGGRELAVISGFLEAVRGGEMAPMILFQSGRSRTEPDRDLRAALNALFDCDYRVPLAASRHWRGGRMVEQRGYRGSPPFATEGVTRMLFENLTRADAVDFICYTGDLQTVLLARGDVTARQGKPAAGRDA